MQSSGGVGRRHSSGRRGCAGGSAQSSRSAHQDAVQWSVPHRPDLPVWYGERRVDAAFPLDPGTRGGRGGGECGPRGDQRQPRKTNMMGMMADGTSRVSWNDQQVRQFMGVSTLSQYTVVADISVAKIHQDAPLDKVYLLGCGVSTGYGAACKTAQVEKDSTCAVFGLGAVGLAAVMGCRAAGASKIIAVDINPKKFKLAQELGATECINPLDHKPRPIQEVLKEKTQGGVDYALECVGNPTVTSEALESTVDAWGVCVAVGWSDAGPINVDVDELLVGRTLKGTYFGGCKGADYVPVLVDKYMKKELKLDEFITHRLSLGEVNKALELLKTGESIRSVISLW
ncbi:alcohol dehydrogenase class-3-like isoform X2 [Boleophthalmus pectinirostris]|uniref:alcohol dehydrogenase class-3-like isoform X2 n=1 Tax=Boleophthalmus pectinirostris TaxID=150288 RepID=UPI00242D0A7C|nr:alcohol dehydrogenase class-3-like isoform X2 [Boleophthalmus pectinirostris]